MADFAKSKARGGDSHPTVVIKRNKTMSGSTLEQSAKNDENTHIDLTKENEQSQIEHTSNLNEWYHWQMQEKSSRHHVSNLKKKPIETFREYAVRWTVEAAKIQPSLSENEAIACFVSSLDSELYYQICHQMMVAMETTFANIVKIGEAIEIKMMLESSAPKTVNAITQSDTDKRKGKEIHAPSHPYLPYNFSGQSASACYQMPFAPKFDAPLNPLVYQLYPQPRGLPNYQPFQNYQSFPSHQPSASHHPQASIRQGCPTIAKPCKKMVKTYTPLPEPIDQMFEKLKVAGLIHPVADKTPYPLPVWFDITKNCAYHSGAPGHDTKNCHSLKDKIESMIKAGVIRIPMVPPYSQSGQELGSGSNIEEKQSREFTFSIEIQKGLYENLKETGILKPLVGEGIYNPSLDMINGVNYCDYHAEYFHHDTKDCTALRHKIQDLIDDGTLQLVSDDEIPE